MANRQRLGGIARREGQFVFLPYCPSQDGVNQPFRPCGIASGKLHRLIYRRTVGDAIHIENLIHAQPQEDHHGQIQPSDGLSRIVSDEMVQRQPTLHRTVGEGGEEGTLLVGKVPTLYLCIQRKSGEFLLFFYASEQLVGNFADVGRHSELLFGAPPRTLPRTF